MSSDSHTFVYPGGGPRFEGSDGALRVSDMARYSVAFLAGIALTIIPVAPVFIICEQVMQRLQQDTAQQTPQIWNNPNWLTPRLPGVLRDINEERKKPETGSKEKALLFTLMLPATTALFILHDLLVMPIIKVSEVVIDQCSTQSHTESKPALDVS